LTATSPRPTRTQSLSPGLPIPTQSSKRCARETGVRVDPLGRWERPSREALTKREQSTRWHQSQPRLYAVRAPVGGTPLPLDTALVTSRVRARRGAKNAGVAAQDVQPQCVHLWSALCASDTHARFVDESQSFRRAVRGFYDTRGKVAFRAFDRGEARDQVERRSPAFNVAHYAKA